MSGFFLVRRSCLDLASLHPQGFMLLLELLVHFPQATVAEVPYTFGARHSGVSKAGIKEEMTYLSRLAWLGPRCVMLRGGRSASPSRLQARRAAVAQEHSYPTGRTPTCGAGMRSRISIARLGCPCPATRRHR
jgi:hypothetical protein